VGGRAIVTSLVREASLEEPSGFVRVVDLERRKVLATFAMPESRHRARDPNPRGGLRGAKGIGVQGDRLVLANTERLFVLDTAWRLVRAISHPWLAGVHDVLCEPEGVWATCSSSDLMLRFDWDGTLGEHWTWRGDRPLAGELGFASPPRFDPELDYRDPVVAHTGVHDVAHVNGVARGSDGLLVSLGRILAPRTVRALAARAVGARLAARAGLGPPALRAVRRRRTRRLVRSEQFAADRFPGSSAALLALSRDTRVLVRTRDVAVPNHNVLEDDGLLVYNDSNASRLVGVDRTSGRERHAVPIPGSPPFARGLAALGAGRFLVGSQAPHALHAIDLAGGRLVSSLDLGGRPRESVYAVALLPDRFDDPPARLDWGPA
jgi:hypothetical protein